MKSCTNAHLFALDLASWPNEKVFGQSQDAERNGLEIAYRFEDRSSFAVLRVKAEQVTYEVKLDQSYIDASAIDKVVKNRISVDFDRGMLGTIILKEFRVDDWLKGCFHLLRRDIDKVLRARK